ncbi:MAG: AAA family ATPase [Chloroflexi bacterium]|nr:MAG: AAA family ATPase [Chloroflexota bacterium]
MTADTTRTASPDGHWGVYGQTSAVASLQHAIASGRLAHAYLFSGPEGIGKATLARRLAQALVCEASPGLLADDDAGRGDAASAGEVRPCLVCRACTQVEAGTSPDIERITVGGICDEGGAGHRDHSADGSTRIRICQVRRLERVASLTPYQSPRRVFIIDTADELQREAAHALLKTLEEPPASVLLIMLATDIDALLPTVRSRCQEIALRPMSHRALAEVLSTDGGMDPATARALAEESHGRYGLAMRLHTDPSLGMLRETAMLDAARIAAGGRNERFDYAATLAGRWSRERLSVLETLEVWRGWWRARLVEAGCTPDLAQCSAPDALRALRAVTRARTHLLENTYPQLALEVMMLDLPVLAADGIREEAREPAVSPA